MRYKAQLTLEYRGKQILADGSPKIVTSTRTVQGFIEEQFSQYYYRESHREMRKAKNISIPNVDIDIIENNINYELVYVWFNNRKYQIKEILKHRSSSMMMLLDCEEVTQ